MLIDIEPPTIGAVVRSRSSPADGMGMARPMADNNDPSTLEEPTADEEAAAERAAEQAPDVEETYRDMTEKGAHQKGEGAID